MQIALLVLTVLLQSVAAPKSKDVSALLAPIREAYDLPGMVCAVVQGETLVATGAVGVRKRGSPDAITIDDKMHLGSCTKSMTATLCARLVTEGKLAWDTRLKDEFPELASKMDPAWLDVRLDQLLTHHGGAPTNLDAGGLWGKLWLARGSPREQRMVLVEGLTSRPPDAPPGTKYIYSNAGVSIAGAMAERAMDKPYEELMRKYVFVPLGMTSAGFGAPGTLGKIDQPRGHREDGTPVEIGTNADNPIAIAPAARVHCSIVDWAKYVSAHLVGEKKRDDGKQNLLTAAMFKTLHTPYGKDADRYAMGWVIQDRPWGGRVLFHNGSNTMWYCVTWLAPEKDFAVLVATNQGGDKAMKAVDEAATALISDHLGLPDDAKRATDPGGAVKPGSDGKPKPDPKDSKGG
jgi:CubicO group peptidase (beta-lactamase class C family)